jgi:6-phosphogluconolactonase
MRYLACLILISTPVWSAPDSVSGYIGTYTSLRGVSNGSAGIYSFHWNARTGSLSAIRAAGLSNSPSFLAMHPNGKFLYAVNEGGSAEADRITAFAIDRAEPSGQLRDLGSVSSMGKGPCHLSLDSSGRWLFVANYRSGGIAVYPVQSSGALGEARQAIRQQGSSAADGSTKAPHAHEIVQTPDGRFVLSVDLGLDAVFVYRFDAHSGALTAHDPAAMRLPSGYGPRHLVFSKDATKVYLLTELTAKLITLRWDAALGSLTRLAEISVLPADYTGPPSAAELALSADGRFLYASNRAQSNSIAAFRLDRHGIPTSIGTLASGGTTPRFIVIDPSGRFLLAANQDSNGIAAFRIDPASGALHLQGDATEIPAPVDIVFSHPLAH